MSADNWAVCPVCEERFPLTPREELRTFREDWEIGLDSKGLVSVYYTGRCTQCGSGVKFEDARSIHRTAR